MEIGKLLDKIPQIKDLVKNLEVVKHLQEISSFLFHPKKFWRKYNRISTKQKRIQYILYSLLFIIICWIASFSGISINELPTILLLEVATLFPYIIIVWLSLLICKGFNKRIALARSFVLCSYTKFLIIPVEIIMLMLYVQIESTVFLGLAVIISLLAELFILMAPITFVKTSNIIKPRTIYICSAFVLLNVLDLAIIIGKIEIPSQDNLKDSIREERFEQGKSIRNAYMIPAIVCVSERTGTKFYLYSFPSDDTIVIKDQMEDTSFIADLQVDLDSLKIITSRCEFSVNKDFFNTMYNIKKQILFVHEHQLFESNQIVKETVLMYENNEIDKLYYRVFDEDVASANAQLYQSEKNHIYQYNLAMSVRNIALLWHVAYLGYIIGTKTGQITI